MMTPMTIFSDAALSYRSEIRELVTFMVDADPLHSLTHARCASA